MAAGIMPAPGTEYGPCEGTCAHTDCADTRTRVAESCGLCADPIGYETPYFNDAEHGVVHANCLYDTMGA